MRSYLSKTIYSLCNEIADMHDSREPGRAIGSYDDVIGFVFEELRKMPVLFRCPILMVTAIFGISRLLPEGSVFHMWPQERRRLQVESWRRSKFGPIRDLIKFYTSLVVIALYSRHETGAKETARDV
jgi:hypothetical protein